MVESTIDKIKDITVERQIRKLAGVIDEQNQKIYSFEDVSTDIENLKASDANQTTQINNLKQSVATDKLATESAITALQSKDAEQDGTLTNHAKLIQGITESLVSDIQIMTGTTTGEIKVRLERESAAAIDSNNYNLGLPVSAEIIQGTGPSMFKIQITMSTGIKVVSNDFVFTTEAIGTDVYISSFTFKAGNQDGYLSADIGLNNGVTIEANNFLVPTDPNVTSAITDLQTRLTTVENSGISDINGLKTTVSEHTSEINTLNSDVANLTTGKADVNNSGQTINTGTVNASNINKNGVSVATVNDIPDISGKVNIAQGTENAGKVLGINASGDVEPTKVSSGGEVWQEISPYAMPTNWKTNDRIKVAFNVTYTVEGGTSWTNNLTSISLNSSSNATLVCEFIINSINNSRYCPIESSCSSKSIKQINALAYNVTKFNEGSYFRFNAFAFNGVGLVETSLDITSSNIASYVKKIWRLKQ